MPYERPKIQCPRVLHRNIDANLRDFDFCFLPCRAFPLHRLPHPSDASSPTLSLNTPVSSPLPSPSKAPSLCLCHQTLLYHYPLCRRTHRIPATTERLIASGSSTDLPLPSPSSTPQTKTTQQTALASFPSTDNQSSSLSPAHSESFALRTDCNCSPSGTLTGASVSSTRSIPRQSLSSFPMSQLPSSPRFDSHLQSPPMPTLGSSNSGYFTK
ncbi:hypothetical protein BGY98DRAFT_738189 [Russula aff. rugulosa BPL654]|nr:hypothetical protein BGY98DRAFT_738189 [Russula aff. rugulosa BPL654]